MFMIAVTGANGFMGAAAVAVLARSGRDVHPIPGKVKLGMWSICSVSAWSFDLQLLAKTAFGVLKQDSNTH